MTLWASLPVANTFAGIMESQISNSEQSAITSLAIPIVLLDTAGGKLVIKGSIALRDSLQFFEPVLQVIRPDLIAHDFDVKVDLEYCDKHSWKAILAIVRQLNLLARNGRTVRIEWYYSSENDNIREMGNAFDFLFNLDFDFIRRDPVKQAG